MIDGCTPYPSEFVRRYIKRGYWRSETIARAIASVANRVATERPGAIAVVDSHRQLTYASLIAQAAAVRDQLAESGIAAGDRIVVQLPNRIEFATLLVACLDVGAIPVMALPAYRRAEMEYLVSFSEAKAIAITPQYRGFDHSALARELRGKHRELRDILSTDPAPGCVTLTRIEGDSETFGQQAGNALEVALFLLSGGTTGLPKLIPRTHADYLYNARRAASVCGIDSRSRLLNVLPIEHNFPLACPGLIGALLRGAVTILSPPIRGAELADLVDRSCATHLPCVPTIAMSLLELEAAERSRVDRLKVITVGGAKLQHATAAGLRRCWPNLKIQQVFGMSEGLLCYTGLDDEDNVAFSTQGRPVSAGDEIRIVDDKGRQVGDGSIGELWCRGPYTIRGYYRAAERNREAFTADGFFHTGDLVRRDRGGNLIIEGRLKDIINRGGEKISTEEVEAHLLQHPAIRAVALVAMPDAMLGERGCAYVTLCDGAALSIEAMREFLDGRSLARFKWPERLEVVAELPLTNVGKIRKAELRRDIELKLARERESRNKAGRPIRS